MVTDYGGDSDNFQSCHAASGLVILCYYKTQRHTLSDVLMFFDMMWMWIL